MTFEFQAAFSLEPLLLDLAFKACGCLVSLAFDILKLEVSHPLIQIAGRVLLEDLARRHPQLTG